MDCTVHGIFQARILEWAAFPFSRGSSQPRDQTQISRISSRFFTTEPLRKPWLWLNSSGGKRKVEFEPVNCWCRELLAWENNSCFPIWVGERETKFLFCFLTDIPDPIQFKATHKWFNWIVKLRLPPNHFLYLSHQGTIKEREMMVLVAMWFQNRASKSLKLPSFKRQTWLLSSWV